MYKAKYMIDPLPEDFDGVFRFTNATEDDFSARWNKVEYTFPAGRMTPMIIPGATPEEVQHIRKKFAKELAERELYKTAKFKKMDNVPLGGTPALYTENDLTPFIQKCLEPLPVAQAKVVKIITDPEQNLRRDNKGKLRTRVLAEGESLMSEASGAIE